MFEFVCPSTYQPTCEPARWMRESRLLILPVVKMRITRFAHSELEPLWSLNKFSNSDSIFLGFTTSTALNLIV